MTHPGAISQSVSSTISVLSKKHITLATKVSATDGQLEKIGLTHCGC